MGLFNWRKKRKEQESGESAEQSVRIVGQTEVLENIGQSVEMTGQSVEQAVKAVRPALIVETAEQNIEPIIEPVAVPIVEPKDIEEIPENPPKTEISPKAENPTEVKKSEKPEKKEKKGFFGRIKSGLKKTREALAYKINKLFTGGVLDDDFYDELEAALIASDMGADTAERVLEDLKEAVDKKHIRNTDGVKAALQEIISEIMLENEPEELSYPAVIMIVGVNGVGKTTSIGKLASFYRDIGKSVLIAAGDTFRAAAADQLGVWADRAGVKVVRHSDGGDPAAVVFDAIKSAQSKNVDVLIADTAGRLHNKAGLMEELKKMSRVIRREYPNADYRNYIVLDATTGQNAVAQVETFDEAIDLDGIIITKLDGTAKGGVLVALADRFALPIYFAGVGEGIDDLIPFDADEFAQGILE